MYRNIALSAGVAALLLATPARAHHPSGAGTAGGAGPIVTIPGTTLEKGHSSAAVVFEYIGYSALSDAQLAVSGHPHSLDALFAPSLLYAYGITDDKVEYRDYPGVGTASPSEVPADLTTIANTRVV